MSEEMKLIVALCSALGFKVERTVNYNERKETKETGIQYIMDMVFRGSDRELKTDASGAYLIDEEGGYISRLKHPEISYKLIKDGAEQ